MDRHKNTALLFVGEDLHILNPRFQQVLDTHDEDGLIELARRQIENGATALDINPGPAKNMAGKLLWVMETIQRRWDIPLFLPASVPLEDGLHRHRGRATINAVTADPDRLDTFIQLAGEHDANLVVLLTKPGLGTIGVPEQLQMAIDVLERTDAGGLPLSHIFLDPVFSVRTDPVTWNLSGGMPDLDRVLELFSLIGELTDGKANTLLALSNGTLGLPAGKRSTFHCRMLPLLVEAGLRGVILNCRDRKLMQLARSLRIGNRLQKKAA
ncbi:MAG TPA: hypothetical protein ENK84_05490 [Desulfobulbus sp.]|nr:hypothetical protein [Desulfobulbus sp.]